jgi:hypothetical protein
MHATLVTGRTTLLVAGDVVELIMAAHAAHLYASDPLDAATATATPTLPTKRSDRSR